MPSKKDKVNNGSVNIAFIIILQISLQSKLISLAVNITSNLSWLNYILICDYNGIASITTIKVFSSHKVLFNLRIHKKYSMNYAIENSYCNVIKCTCWIFFIPQNSGIQFLWWNFALRFICACFVRPLRVENPWKYETKYKELLSTIAFEN